MSKYGFLATLFAAAATVVSAQSGAWQQCGGIGWAGETTCVSGYVCTHNSDYYWQCIPGTGGSTTPTTTPTGTGTTSAASGTATLQPGYSFIRGVEAPFFHYYLQSQKVNTAGDAVLGSPSTASQFQITGGQLIQNAGGTNLYAIVESRADSTVVKLKLSWSTTPATAGTFEASGDTITWSIPTISRPQTNAWLICPDGSGNNLVYINLGNYGYQTPAGCSDQTIHYYTGATATP